MRTRQSQQTERLSEEQRMMRQSCRDFVDDVVLPFISRTGSANGR